MPLSENEQRLLEQMERALYAEDPKFASTMRGSARRAGALPRMVLGGIGVIAGLGVLVGGVSQGNVILGVVGFLLMLLGTVFTFSSRRRGPAVTGVVAADGSVRPPAGPAASAKARKNKTQGSFMQRMEQRWDRRRDEP